MIDCTARTDSDLCLAWRHSYLELQTAAPAGRLAISEQRRAYLDEMHHRNPQGVTKWLAEGARAASDPAKFLLPPRTADTSKPAANDMLDTIHPEATAVEPRACGRPCSWPKWSTVGL